MLFAPHLHSTGCQPHHEQTRGSGEGRIDQQARHLHSLALGQPVSGCLSSWPGLSWGGVPGCAGAGRRGCPRWGRLRVGRTNTLPPGCCTSGRSQMGPKDSFDLEGVCRSEVLSPPSGVQAASWVRALQEADSWVPQSAGRAEPGHGSGDRRGLPCPVLALQVPR